VKDLAKPFKFTMPISASESTEDKHCVYFDTLLSIWKSLECEGEQVSDSEVRCCSYHMTEFAVVDMPTAKGFGTMAKYAGSLLVIVNMLTLAFVFLGWHLDSKKPRVVEEAKVAPTREGESGSNGSAADSSTHKMAVTPEKTPESVRVSKRMSGDIEECKNNTEDDFTNLQDIVYGNQQNSPSQSTEVERTP